MENKIQKLLEEVLELVSEENKEEAEKKLLEAANLGSIEAKMYLGIFYTIEKAGASEEGIYWLKQAAEAGKVEAALTLVASYLDDEGYPTNKEEFLFWLTKAADLGSPEAQYYLAEIYAEGEVVAADHDKALQLVILSAESGYAEAQYNLGLGYLQGELVEPNKELAIHWFKQAMEQGYEDAEFELANIYCEDGNPEGVNMIIALAEEGYWAAQNQLAEMYEKGLHVEKDQEQAKYWKEKAGENTFE